jgi:signal transduction protein with GAF and PtsI domain
MSQAITKWGQAETTPTVRFFYDRIRSLVAARLQGMASDRAAAVVERSEELLSAADLEAIERELLASGHRFEFSATISIRERPEAYKAKVGAAVAATAQDADGRIEVGNGDNLVRRAQNLTGIARFISALDQVTDMLINGVPPDTVAVIDDSGGTLTAPILEGFAGVLCLGGTVRSHLGILTREYGIPCLMNCKIDGGLADGDQVEVEYSAAAVSGGNYESGGAVRARIWKLAR